MKNLIIEDYEDYLRIVLNRPEKRNALSPELILEMHEVLDKYESTECIKFITITGSGAAFSAGADLDYLKQISDNSYEENLNDSNLFKSLFEKIYTFPKPVIAVVNGHAIAGGCGLATVCDIVLANENAMFGYTEVKIGFIAALVMVYLHRIIGEKHANHLLLSGDLITAEQAESYGLVSKVFSNESFEADLEKYLTILKKNSSNSLSETKKLFRLTSQMERENALDLAAKANAKIRQHPDCKEGVSAFLEKRPAKWVK